MIKDIFKKNDEMNEHKSRLLNPLKNNKNRFLCCDAYDHLVIWRHLWSFITDLFSLRNRITTELINLAFDWSIICFNQWNVRKYYQFMIRLPKGNTTIEYMNDMKQEL